MPTGLKQSSSLIVIGARVDDTLAPGTFAQGAIDLQLNPLDNEVFVVQAVDIDCAPPDALAGVDTSVSASVTTTSQTALASLSSTNTIARKELAIRASGFVDGGVGFETASMETPPGNLDYVAIIATNDFFVQLKSTNNTQPRSATVKMYGYRATASSSIYAALVQSELLSS
tara:strand:- start:1180 stop:1695 length:516 start_codon:yes stop_codon:yes gene_type:complete